MSSSIYVAVTGSLHQQETMQTHRSVSDMASSKVRSYDRWPQSARNNTDTQECIRHGIQYGT